MQRLRTMKQSILTIAANSEAVGPSAKHRLDQLPIDLYTVGDAGSLRSSSTAFTVDAAARFRGDRMHFPLEQTA